MSDNRLDDNIKEEETGIEDFPKEIVQLLMKNHPIKNPGGVEEPPQREKRKHEETNHFEMTGKERKKPRKAVEQEELTLPEEKLKIKPSNILLEGFLTFC